MTTVRVFILLLWVFFCCVCPARFFFAAGAQRVLFVDAGDPRNDLKMSLVGTSRHLQTHRNPQSEPQRLSP